MMMHSPGTFWSAGTQNATDLLPSFEEPNGFGANGTQRLYMDMIGKENHNRMNNPNNLKQKLCDYVMEERDSLYAFGEDIFLHPELGYREHRTHRKLQEALLGIGVTDMATWGLTGIKAWLPGAKDPRLPNIAILGEMDAVVSPNHPQADPITGAAHACGHHAGLTAMLGAGMALSKALPELAGNICLIAAPAEEYVEIDYRRSLLASGKIRYLGGKQQLISEGCFDDIHIAMMVHALSDSPVSQVCVSSTAGGFIGKSVRFKGQEAHAGGAPHLGVNALNAASAALMCIHALRETFRDEDHVRIHPIITKGGDMVNTVPADVRMESYVRAASLGAMADANAKVNRAIRGASYALGAESEIEDLPGYLPLEEARALSQIFADNAALLFPEASVSWNRPFCGSTDMGDLSYIMPVIQPTVSGFAGALHSKDFRVTDPRMAYLAPAVLMAATTADLLADGAQRAAALLRDFASKDKGQYDHLWQEFLSPCPEKNGSNI